MLNASENDCEWNEELTTLYIYKDQGLASFNALTQF